MAIKVKVLMDMQNEYGKGWKITTDFQKGKLRSDGSPVEYIRKLKRFKRE